MINMKLAEERGLDEETIEKIQLCQGFLNDVLSNPDMLIDDPRDVATCIEECEFKLQGLWGFEQSKKFHRYAFDVKWCRCPKLDNAEMVGWTDKRYINMECPYHGVNPALTWDDERFSNG